MAHPEVPDRKPSPESIEKILRMVADSSIGNMAAEIIDSIAEMRATTVFFELAINSGDLPQEETDLIKERVAATNEEISYTKGNLAAFLNMGFGGDGNEAAKAIIADKTMLGRFISSVMEKNK